MKRVTAGSMSKIELTRLRGEIMLRNTLNVIFFFYVCAFWVITQGTLYAQDQRSRADQIQIAVLDFEGQGISQVEASMLTNELRTYLEEVGTFAVLEKEMMDAILDRKAFELLECISSECAVEVGQHLGVKRIIAGGIVKSDRTYRVHAQVIDIESGKTVYATMLYYSGGIGGRLGDIGTFALKLNEGMKKASSPIAKKEKESRADKIQIAVLDFEGQGISDREASTLTNELRTYLEKAGTFAVLEKEMMDAILDRKAFELLECISSECAVEVGQHLGVRRIITGGIVKSDRTYRVHAQVIDIETGKTVYATMLYYSGGIDGRLGEMGTFALKLNEGMKKASSPVAEKEKEKEKIAVASDRTAPTITISQPSITRGMKKRISEKKIMVRGKASDENGIYEVLVNGTEAQLSADGTFWADVRLRVGENILEIIAENTKGNRATKSFTVIRESAAPPPPVVVKSKEFIFGDYYALVIANQDYTYNSVTDLDYPIQDAKKIIAALTEYYTFDKGNVYFLENPDRGEILKKFTELRRNLKENDNLLIFYAGHGYWDEDERQGYWLPRNADWNDRSDWLSNSVLRDKIRALKAKHTLLISDACFSGGIFKVREAFVNPEMSIQKIYEMPSRKALTSGALMTVPDKSVFVEYLVKRLKNNKEKYLYSEKLYVNMKDAVINNSPTNQTPQFGVIGSAGDEGGDFVFVRKNK